MGVSEVDSTSLGEIATQQTEKTDGLCQGKTWAHREGSRTVEEYTCGITQRGITTHWAPSPAQGLTLGNTSGSSRQSSDDHVITVTEDEVRRELKRVNVRKAAEPDGITGCVMRSCADQLAGLFTSIFHSLATSVVPTSFKKSVIIPVPKNSKPSCLNDYHPVALTSTAMKVFERLLKNHFFSSIPATLDPLQFAYRPNRSTDDAFSGPALFPHTH